MSDMAGWAQADITPPLGLPMGGRGPKNTPGAAVLDPLSAQALLLQDGRGRRVLIVSLDLIGLSRGQGNRLRNELAAAVGIDPQAVVINCAHTHSGPSADADHFIPIAPVSAALADYQQLLCERIVPAAKTAAERLRLVSVTWHEGRSLIAMNRRRRMDDGKVQMRPNPQGLRHPDLWALDIRPAGAGSSGRCLLFCHACHPVIVYGFAYDSISADFPGRARRRLSTGEAIGVGAALMMVVLTAWERDANLLRPRRSQGTLRLLFLDEANRLSQDNLGVLFDLCQNLDLQLMIASPEVARSEGNTTYRLVRRINDSGQEEVIVTGRRVVAKEQSADVGSS